MIAERWQSRPVPAEVVQLTEANRADISRWLKDHGRHAYTGRMAPNLLVIAGSPSAEPGDWIVVQPGARPRRFEVFVGSTEWLRARYEPADPQPGDS